MRSQEQIVGYVLLGAVVLGVALTVYNYVVPLVQKSYVRNTLSSVESKLSDFADRISKTALDFGVSTFQLDIQNSYFEIDPDLIQLRIKIPIQYYSSIVKVPVNYDEYTYCPNDTFTISYSGKLCSDRSHINITISTGSFRIIDEISNKSVDLPLGNLNNVITSDYVFDIIYNGTHLRFLPRYPTGYYRTSPPCIINALQLGGEVSYEITCRPIVNMENGQCFWIRLSPYGVSATQITTKIPVVISYRRYYDNSYNSTVCSNNLVREIYVDISISS
ncbi:MAG: hypothetical protein BXU00_01720 [Candidatus Nanoclepta minutus]|uniref:Uncharacterized protein n=1 Tax=Candidatus Nanoclepta minutus TaxID=1940235 RepID=A0A397WQW2_9ARCH|nr:MAG: hypothetical protein BXU00_01720 [Candidatus Nanoclepta minutus]